MKYKCIPVINIVDLQEAVPEEMMKIINISYKEDHIVPFFGFIYDLAEDVADTMFKLNLRYRSMQESGDRQSLHNDFIEFLRKTFATEYVIIDDAAEVFCL